MTDGNFKFAGRLPPCDDGVMEGAHGTEWGVLIVDTTVAVFADSDA